MIEVNRSLYLNNEPDDVGKSNGYEFLKEGIRSLVDVEKGGK